VVNLKIAITRRKVKRKVERKVKTAGSRTAIRKHNGRRLTSSNNNPAKVMNRKGARVALAHPSNPSQNQRIPMRRAVVVQRASVASKRVISAATIRSRRMRATQAARLKNFPRVHPHLILKASTMATGLKEFCVACRKKDVRRSPAVPMVLAWIH
jgi:hypothetical protein